MKKWCVKYLGISTFLQFVNFVDAHLWSSSRTNKLIDSYGVVLVCDTEVTLSVAVTVPLIKRTTQDGMRK